MMLAVANFDTKFNIVYFMQIYVKLNKENNNMKRTITDFFGPQPKKRYPLNPCRLKRSWQQQALIHQWNQPIPTVTAQVTTLVMLNGRRCLTWKRFAF